MLEFKPFANNSQSVGISELTLENQGQQVNIYGSLTLTIDKGSLSYAKELQRILTEAVAYLESQNASQIDISDVQKAQQANVAEVKNPFA